MNGLTLLVCCLMAYQQAMQRACQWQFATGWWWCNLSMEEQLMSQLKTK